MEKNNPTAARLKQTLTVQELRDTLADLPDDMPVVFQYDYGDHCHSQVCATISEIEEGDVEYSGYISMLQFQDVDEEGNPEKGTMKAIILK